MKTATTSHPKVSTPQPPPPIAFQDMHLLTYALEVSRKPEFARFFAEAITPWLKKQNIKARSWITGNVLFALVTDPRPWTGIGGIPQLEKFLAGNGWVDNQKLPDVG